MTRASGVCFFAVVLGVFLLSSVSADIIVPCNFLSPVVTITAESTALDPVVRLEGCSFPIVLNFSGVHMFTEVNVVSSSLSAIFFMDSCYTVSIYMHQVQFSNSLNARLGGILFLKPVEGLMLTMSESSVAVTQTTADAGSATTQGFLMFYDAVDGVTADITQSVFQFTSSNTNVALGTSAQLCLFAKSAVDVRISLESVRFTSAGYRGGFLIAFVFFGTTAPPAVRGITLFSAQSTYVVSGNALVTVYALPSEDISFHFSNDTIRLNRGAGMTVSSEISIVFLYFAEYVDVSISSCNVSADSSVFTNTAVFAAYYCFTCAFQLQKSTVGYFNTVLFAASEVYDTWTVVNGSYVSGDALQSGSVQSESNLEVINSTIDRAKFLVGFTGADVSNNVFQFSNTTITSIVGVSARMSNTTIRFDNCRVSLSNLDNGNFNPLLVTSLGNISNTSIALMHSIVEIRVANLQGMITTGSLLAVFGNAKTTNVTLALGSRVVMMANDTEAITAAVSIGGNATRINVYLDSQTSLWSNATTAGLILCNGSASNITLSVTDSSVLFASAGESTIPMPPNLMQVQMSSAAVMSGACLLKVVRGSSDIAVFVRSNSSIVAEDVVGVVMGGHRVTFAVEDSLIEVFGSLVCAPHGDIAFLTITVNRTALSHKALRKPTLLLSFIGGAAWVSAALAVVLSDVSVVASSNSTKWIELWRPTSLGAHVAVATQWSLLFSSVDLQRPNGGASWMALPPLLRYDQLVVSLAGVHATANTAATLLWLQNISGTAMITVSNCYVEGQLIAAVGVVGGGYWSASVAVVNVTAILGSLGNAAAQPLVRVAGFDAFVGQINVSNSQIHTESDVVDIAAAMSSNVSVVLHNIVVNITAVHSSVVRFSNTSNISVAVDSCQVDAPRLIAVEGTLVIGFQLLVSASWTNCFRELLFIHAVDNCAASLAGLPLVAVRLENSSVQLPTLSGGGSLLRVDAGSACDGREWVVDIDIMSTILQTLCTKVRDGGGSVYASASLVHIGGENGFGAAHVAVSVSNASVVHILNTVTESAAVGRLSALITTEQNAPSPSEMNSLRASLTVWGNSTVWVEAVTPEVDAVVRGIPSLVSLTASLGALNGSGLLVNATVVLAHSATLALNALTAGLETSQPSGVQWIRWAAEVVVWVGDGSVLTINSTTAPLLVDSAPISNVSLTVVDASRVVVTYVPTSVGFATTTVSSSQSAVILPMALISAHPLLSVVLQVHVSRGSEAQLVGPPSHARVPSLGVVALVAVASTDVAAAAAVEVTVSHARVFVSSSSPCSLVWNAANRSRTALWVGNSDVSVTATEGGDAHLVLVLDSDNHVVSVNLTEAVVDVFALSGNAALVHLKNASDSVANVRIALSHAAVSGALVVCNRTHNSHPNVEVFNSSLAAHSAIACVRSCRLFVDNDGSAPSMVTITGVSNVSIRDAVVRVEDGSALSYTSTDMNHHVPAIVDAADSQVTVVAGSLASVEWSQMSAAIIHTLGPEASGSSRLLLSSQCFATVVGASYVNLSSVGITAAVSGTQFQLLCLGLSPRESGSSINGSIELRLGNTTFLMGGIGAVLRVVQVQPELSGSVLLSDWSTTPMTFALYCLNVSGGALQTQDCNAIAGLPQCIAEEQCAYSQQTSTTEEPATTTAEPPTTTSEAPLTTTSTTTEPLTTTTEESATTTAEPVTTTTEEPATTTTEPLTTTTEEPATTTAEPLTTTTEAPLTTTSTTAEPLTTTTVVATTTTSSTASPPTTTITENFSTTSSTASASPTTVTTLEPTSTAFTASPPSSSSTSAAPTPSNVTTPPTNSSTTAAPTAANVTALLVVTPHANLSAISSILQLQFNLSVPPNVSVLMNTTVQLPNGTVVGNVTLSVEFATSSVRDTVVNALQSSASVAFQAFGGVLLEAVPVTAAPSTSPSPPTTSIPSTAAPTPQPTEPLAASPPSSDDSTATIVIVVVVVLVVAGVVVGVVLWRRHAASKQKTVASMNAEDGDAPSLPAKPTARSVMECNDASALEMEQLSVPLVITAADGSEFKILEEDEEGFYDEEGYYHYYVDE